MSTDTKTRYQDIRERLEKATGSDRELDWAIYETLRPFNSPAEHKASYDEDSEGYWFWISDQPFTKSLDYTIALIERVLPELADRTFIQTSKPAKAGWLKASRKQHIYFEGATPALALLIALFHALEAKERP